MERQRDEIEAFAKCVERSDKRKPKKRIPNYIAPQVHCLKLTAQQYSRRRTRTTYKYPVGYRRVKEPKVVTTSFGEDSYDQELSASSRKRKVNVSGDETHDRTDRPSKRRRLQPKKKQNGYINNGVDSEHSFPDPITYPPQERHTLPSILRRVLAQLIHSVKASTVSTHGSSVQKSMPPKFQSAWKTEGQKQQPIISPPGRPKTPTQGDKTLFLEAEAHPFPPANLSEEEE
ncbi:hypothetical protein MMC14_009102 [Varicellaria rhodocarpa]|nr:hypothetical protein [Varicellaria rhodocarpa]